LDRTLFVIRRIIMPQKIKGNIGEAGRILILDESDLSAIEINEVIGASGGFDIEVPVSGTKMVIARNNNGETIGYGAVSSVFEPNPEVPIARTYYVGANTDDGEVGADYGFTSTKTSGWMGLISNYHLSLFFRFPNVTIPKDSVIQEAYLNIKSSRYKTTGPLHVDIYGNNTGNAVAPTSTTQYSNMARTAAVTWYNVPVFSKDIWYLTPDIVSQVQQIVNRPDWVSGNAMLFTIQYRAGNTGYREVYLKDSGIAQQLKITYMGIPE
jgi:hypothetical protein